MPDQIKPAYLGEALLLRWGESASQGRTVTLQLDEEGQTHPFKGLKAGGNGQRMKLCAVLIDDHEQPQEPDRARRSGPTKVAEKKTVEAEVQKERTPFDKLPRSQQAAMKLQDEEFRSWLFRDDHFARGRIGSAEDQYEEATAFFKDRLKIASRKELDSDPVKSSAWDRIMTDYSVRGLVR